MTASPDLRVVTIPEWHDQLLDDLSFGKADRDLSQTLCAGTNGRLVIDELRSGLRVRSKSWVGVIRFSGFELRVVPKLVDGDLGLVQMIDFASGLDALKRYPAVKSFDANGAGLLDLVALLLAEAGEQIVRGGLKADYQEMEEGLAVLKGRLLVRQQVLRRFGQIDRLECRFDEHTTDTLDNQLLLAALVVCAPRVRHPAVAMRVRRLLTIFSEACSTDGLDLRVARASLQYDRLNAHYRDGHTLAWLVLDGMGIENLFAAGSHGCFAFLFDMNRLFEEFITRWLSTLLPRGMFHVHPQRRDRTIVWDADRNRSYIQVIPDLLIEHGAGAERRSLPVDAKYKLYNEKTISPSDIYQSFLYAFAYGRETSAGVLPTTLLLYPASSPSGGVVRLHVRRMSGSTGAEVRAIGIYLPSAVAEAISDRTGDTGSTLVGHIGQALLGSDGFRARPLA